MSPLEDDFVFKISVIGNGQVGKTSLIRRYTQASFEVNYVKTLGAQFSTFSDRINGFRCKLTLWDIAGQREHYFLRPAFYKGTSAAIIVFSLVFIVGLEEHKSHATAISIILPLSILSSLMYIKNINIDFVVVIYVAFGSVIGGFVGAKLLNKVPNRLLRKLFGAFMIIAAIRMVIK